MYLYTELHRSFLFRARLQAVGVKLGRGKMIRVDELLGGIRHSRDKNFQLKMWRFPEIGASSKSSIKK